MIINTIKLRELIEQDIERRVIQADTIKDDNRAIAALTALETEHLEYVRLIESIEKLWNQYNK